MFESQCFAKAYWSNVCDIDAVFVVLVPIYVLIGHHSP